MKGDCVSGRSSKAKKRGVSKMKSMCRGIGSGSGSARVAARMDVAAQAQAFGVFALWLISASMRGCGKSCGEVLCQDGRVAMA